MKVLIICTRPDLELPGVSSADDQSARQVGLDSGRYELVDAGGSTDVVSSLNQLVGGVQVEVVDINYSIHFLIDGISYPGSLIIGRSSTLNSDSLSFRTTSSLKKNTANTSNAINTSRYCSDFVFEAWFIFIILQYFSRALKHDDILYISRC